MARQLFGTLAVLSLLAPVAAAAAPEVRTGLFPAGEAYAPPAADAPRRESHAWVRTVSVAGDRVRIEVPVRGGGPLLLWTLVNGSDAKAPASVTLRTPGQRTLRVGEAASADATLRRLPADTGDLGLGLPGAREAILVTDAEPGFHEIELEPGAGAMAVTVVAAEPNSPVALTTWAGPLSRQPGQPVTLHAILHDSDQRLPGAGVTARLAAPGKAGGRSIRLYDDGRHGDGAAADGEYAVTLARLEAEAAGFWNVRFEAAGRDSRGLAFARTGGSGFMNEPGAARLQGVRAKLVNDPAGSRVHVEAQAAVSRAGRYRLDVIVAGAEGVQGQRSGLAWGESSDRLRRGTARLSLEVPLPEGHAGPYLLDVRLLGLDSPSLGGRTTLAVP